MLDHWDILICREWEQRCEASQARSMLRRIRAVEQPALSDWMFAVITALSLAVLLLAWVTS